MPKPSPGRDGPSGEAGTTISYVGLQGFVHTVLRNVAVCITISLATMTLNRYWRSMNGTISVLTWAIAFVFLLISIYINAILSMEMGVHERRLESDAERALFQRWKYITWFLLACQIFFVLSYCFIARVIYKESLSSRRKKHINTRRSSDGFG